MRTSTVVVIALAISVLGFIAFLTFGTASAKVIGTTQHTGIEKVQSIDDWESINKYYDYDSGIVCYTNKQGYSGGISCIKL